MFDRAKAYRAITKGVLGEYLILQAKVANLPERIAAERARLTAIRSASAESAAVSGSGVNMRQERDTAIIAECDRLSSQLQLARKDLACIENALAALDEKERRVVELMDIQQQSGAVDRLCTEMGYERTKVYIIHNRALDKFSAVYNGAK